MDKIASFKQAIKRCGSITILCLGNSDRGDDGAAFELYKDLTLFLQTNCNTLNKKNIQIDFRPQLQVEDALNISSKRPVLIIDSAVELDNDFTLSKVTNPTASSPLSHSLTPSQLLSVCDQIQIPRPENLWVLAIKGEQYELGDPLSDNCRKAIRTLREELQEIFRYLLDDLVQMG